MSFSVIESSDQRSRYSTAPMDYFADKSITTISESSSRQPSYRLSSSFSSPRSATVETSRVELQWNERGEKQINQYILEKEIGRGTSGSVQRVRSTIDSKLYAMKIVNKSLLKKARSRRVLSGGKLAADQGAQLKREIAIMKKLTHPNVVRLVEVMDDPQSDHLYMVMEYMPLAAISGTELERNPLPLDLARKYFRDTVMGLEYLHHQGVIHRDIKPENLLIADNGSIKIGDFGVSQLFEGENDRVSTTAGSAAFMAPEMVDANGPFSGKMADIWSLGVTLFVFVYGKLPFIGRSVHMTYEKIAHYPPQFFDYPSIPAELKDLLLRLLIKDPKKRITIKEIKEHPWVTNDGKEPMPDLADENSVPTTVTPHEISLALTLVSRVVLVVKLKRKMKCRRMQLLLKRLYATEGNAKTTFLIPSLSSSSSPSVSPRTDNPPSI